MAWNFFFMLMTRRFLIKNRRRRKERKERQRYGREGYKNLPENEKQSKINFG